MSIRTIYLKWAERHVNRLNVILHLIGIPLTVAALPLLVLHSYLWTVLLFVSGYALQFIGHAIEGNKSGEQLLFEKILRRRKSQIPNPNPPDGGKSQIPNPKSQHKSSAD